MEKNQVMETPETHVYRVYWGDSNDRDEVCRVRASCLVEALKAGLEFMGNPKTVDELYTGDSMIATIDSCHYCEFRGSEACEGCELSEYIEVELDDEADPSFKTILGTNDFIDTTTGEGPTVYNETLAKAWERDPQLGALVLLGETLREKPELSNGVDPRLKTKIDEAYKQLQG